MLFTSFLLLQTDECHSRFLVWRNCRGGASFANLLAAVADLPLAAARRAAALAVWQRAANTVQEDCELSPAAAGAMVGELGDLCLPMDCPPATDVFWKAVLPEGGPVKTLPAVISAAKMAAPLALEAQLQQAMMKQLQDAAAS